MQTSTGKNGKHAEIEDFLAFFRQLSDRECLMTWVVFGYLHYSLSKFNLKTMSRDHGYSLAGGQFGEKILPFRSNENPPKTRLVKWIAGGTIMNLSSILCMKYILYCVFYSNMYQ